MQRWGAGSFENSVAHDWLKELLSDSKSDTLVEALQKVTVLNKRIPAATACEAVAAAELIAALGPDSNVILPDEISTWLKRQRLRPTLALLELARQAIEKVGSHESELREVWFLESRNGKEWLRFVEELHGQLTYDAPEGPLGGKEWWRIWN